MTFTPIQPMEAPDYEESSKVLTNPMQAVFDSARKDAETAEINANKNDSTLAALGEFSKTLASGSKVLLEKRIEDQKAKALYDAYMEKSIPQEVVDQHDAEVDKMEKESNTIQKFASKVEENDDHDIVSERVRSADPYYQYYYKLGKLRQMAADMPVLLEQLKGVMTIDDGDGNQLSFDSLNQVDDIAQWNGQAQMQILKAFTGVSPALLAKEVYPKLDEAFARSSRVKAQEMKKKRKDERDFQVKDTLRDGINELLEGNDTTITNIFNNQIGPKISNTEFWNTLTTLAGKAALSPDVIEKLEGISFIDRGTGKPTLVGKKFRNQLDDLETAINEGNIKDARIKMQTEELANLKKAQNYLAELNDDDGYTVSQVDEFASNLGFDNSSQARQLLNSSKDGAVDFLSQEDQQTLYLSNLEKIDKGYWGWNDVEREVKNPNVKFRLKQYMRGKGISEGGENPATKYATQLQYVEEAILKEVNLTKDMAKDPSVNLEIVHQQRLLLADLKKAEYGNEQTGTTADVFQRWKSTWEILTDPAKTKGYVDADGYPGAMSRFASTTGLDASEQRRVVNAGKAYTALNKEGKTIYDDPGKFYDEKQITIAGKQFAESGKVDDFTRVLSKQTGQTNYQILNGIHKAMLGTDLPVPQEVVVLENNMTPTARAMLNNFPSEQRLMRLQGGPYPLVSQSRSVLPTEYRQRGNEMLSFMTGELGLSSNHAIGLLVNMERESSLRTTVAGDNGTSNGLFQWHAGRLTRAKAALGPNWDNWRAQIKYALEEPEEMATIKEFLETDFASPQEAADFWMRYWERPAYPDRDSDVHRRYIPSWMN